MPGPFRLVNPDHFTLVSFHPLETLENIVEVARELRRRQYQITVHGNSFEAADGLSQDERETVQEALS
jgi:hypothetical protein